MKIRGLYHCGSNNFLLAKSLGFNAVEIAIAAAPGSYPAMIDSIHAAHAAGLNAMIAPWGYEKDDKGREIFTLNGEANGLKFLWDNQKIILPEDIVMMVDEPNLYSVPIMRIGWLNHKLKAMLPGVKTSVTLSWIRSFAGWGEAADIVGVDYYAEPLDLASHIKLAYKVLMLKRELKGELMAVPCIRYSPEHIGRQHYFWSRVLGAKNFMWYSASGNGGKWGFSNLFTQQNYMEALEKVLI